MSADHVFYGSRVDATEISATLEHLFETNLQNELDDGERPTPICIWGTHGIGKTRLVQDFAKKNGWILTYCAPAQFEEMGDLHGLPMRMDPDPEVVGDEYTVYLPPEWVPKEEGPGILLLDDLNRSDDRILRGTMQLMQNFEMFAWQLPPKWQIVATANPEGGDYSVTPMDDAMLTRMMHITMVFDVKAWAAWAVNNDIDPRGIAFALTYPETITGQRTTARSLTQFFKQIKHIKDLKGSLDMITVLANSALDDITVATFLSFVNDNLQQLINPEDILDAPKFAPIKKRLTSLAKGVGDAKRVDRIATICTRLYLHVAKDDYKPNELNSKNLVSFLLHADMPNDLRFSLHRDLVSLGGDRAKMLRDPKLAKAVLGGM
ncbi:MAG TPA: hypothetical protein QF695_16195, partial [Arenicellales bacterium]|jgi:MoxR-like ATPase|nr:hypothetical protein [Arenicellales bacterium]